MNMIMLGFGRKLAAAAAGIVILAVGLGKAAGEESPVRIVVDDLDKWKVEIYAGSGGGAMAFDEYGNAFMAGGTVVSVITSDGNLHLLAGGLPGLADGLSERACFGSINSIALGPDGAIYVSDAGNFCIKKVFLNKDGQWTVATVAGVPGRKGHKDGRATEALLERPEGLAFDSKGNLYTMDQDWLRRLSPDGQLTTLNDKGGTGKDEDGPLATAKFQRIMGSGAISISTNDVLYQADLWNNVMRRIDLQAGQVTTIAGNMGRTTFKEGMPRSVDGDAVTTARFHGINGAILDPVTGRIYFHAVDEDWIRCLTSDGKVISLGPLKSGKGNMVEGALKDAVGAVGLSGVDRQGRVYGGQGGVIWRLYRDPAYDKAVPIRTPNPLLQLSRVPPAKSEAPPAGKPAVRLGGDGTATLAAGEGRILSTANYLTDPVVVAGNGEYVVLWQDGSGVMGRPPSRIAVCRLDAAAAVKAMGFAPSTEDGQQAPAAAYAAKRKAFLAVWQSNETGGARIRGKLLSGNEVDLTTGLDLVGGPGRRLRPAVASDGENFMLTWHELTEKAGVAPKYAVRARLLGPDAQPKSEPFTVEESGAGAVVGFDGTQYVVACELGGGSIYARRISVEGILTDKEKGIKMGGQWARRPALASNGRVMVVTGSRRGTPNPWGWNGPGTISMGRLTADGKTPERIDVSSAATADGGFAGLLDRAQWKGRKGWPEGIPGGFKATENGYWPHGYSAACWDGKSWVAAWVRGRMRGRDMTIDLDIFASRVNPETMMPVGEPVLVAGGEGEPGAQTMPTLAGGTDGTSLLVYQSVQPDGTVQLLARRLSGGAAQKLPETKGE